MSAQLEKIQTQNFIAAKLNRFKVLVLTPSPVSQLRYSDYAQAYTQIHCEE